MSLVRRIARPLLATIFITGGLDALRHPSRKAQAAEPMVKALAGPLGLPDDTELLVRANGATMIAGGALLATGRMPRVAATALAGSLVPSTIAGHPFWNETDPQKKAEQKQQFMKNLSVLGGVLLAAVDTAGKPGLAYRARMLGDAASRTKGSIVKDARYAAGTARREAKLKLATATDALS